MLPADRVVSLPLLRGPGIEGLPMNEDGFVICDAEGRVEDAPAVRVVGDAGTFPLKEGGIASGQADAVAAEIARANGFDAEDAPASRSWTGAASSGTARPGSGGRCPR